MTLQNSIQKLSQHPPTNTAKDAVCEGEQLPEAVSGYPVLYNNFLKDFKNRIEWDLVWDEIRKSVGCTSDWLLQFLLGSNLHHRLVNS